MAVLRIRTLPDPVLRQKAKRVSRIDDSVRRLIDDMIDTLHAAGHGVGLAATQVGKPLRIAVVQLPNEPVRVLVNPEITRRTGERVVDEGCLSVPGYHADVRRSVGVRVKCRNRDGKETRLKAEELLAQVIEHELDHLDGILFSDRLADGARLEKVEPGQEEAAEAPAAPAASI